MTSHDRIDHSLLQWAHDRNNLTWVQQGVELIRSHPGHARHVVDAGMLAMKDGRDVNLDQSFLGILAHLNTQTLSEAARVGVHEATQSLLVRRQLRDGDAWSTVMRHDIMDTRNHSHSTENLTKTEGIIKLLDEVLPQGHERVQLFDVLLENSMDLALYANSQGETRSAWSVYATLMGFGARTRDLHAQPRWLDDWMTLCRNYDVEETATATRLLGPLVELGLDVNLRDEEGKTPLQARTGKKFDGFRWEHVIIETLMDLGADWSDVSEEETPPEIWNKIQKHPRVNREHLNAIVDRATRGHLTATEIRRHKM